MPLAIAPVKFEEKKLIVTTEHPILRRDKKKRPNCAAPFSLVGWLRLLEVNPCANFHLAPAVHRAGDPAKVLRSRKRQTTRIRWLVVVKDVSELHGERRAHAFRELDVLGNRRIH